jgi:hypothetical protein
MVSFAIPFFGGLYAALLGYRKIGKRPGEDLALDVRLARYGRLLRVLGPLVMILSALMLAKRP